MAGIASPSILVCLKCGREVTLLRIAVGGATEAMPCGHRAGFTSALASAPPQTVGT